MSLGAKLGLLFLVAAFAGVACKKSSRVEAIEPLPSASAEPAPEPAPAPALDIGPAAAADREAQKTAVFALLAGELAADSLPEVATEPGEPLDHRLRDRLSPVESGLGSLRPRGNVSVGAVEASAPISNGARVVAGMRAGFRNCYGRALVETPQAAGVVNMLIQIDAAGGVTDAKAKSAARLPAVMLSCLQARAKAARFDPPSDVKTATIKFTVTFALP